MFDAAAAEHPSGRRDAAAHEPPRRPPWARLADRPWAGPAALAIAVVAAAAIAALLLDTTSSDLDVFFWPSAEIAAHGQPLLVYTVRSGAYPDANGPLGLLPLSLVALIADGLGIATQMPARDALTEGVFAAFTLLMAREALLAVEAGRGRPARRTLTLATFLVLPPLWFATIGFGHVEGPMELWLILLGARLLGRGAVARGGLCLGLAMLTRSLAAITLVPLLLTLLLARRPAAAGLLLATAAATAAAGLAPFWLADRSDLVYSLLTYRGSLPIAGGTLWFAFRQAPWAGVIQADDWLLFGAAAAGLSLLALGRRPAGGLSPPRVHGLLAVATLCAPMLAKTSWPYYLLDPSVLVTVWWLARPGSVLGWRAAAPLLLGIGGGVLGALEQSQPLAPLPGAVIGVASSAGIAAVIALLLADLLARVPEAPIRASPERDGGVTPPSRLSPTLGT
jgi:hypothetical protein